MAALRMVPLTSASNAFQARVIAARLGAEGVLWELRGNVDGPYPFGQVEILVEAADLEMAKELLLADEVEDAFGAPDVDDRAPRELWFVLLAIVAVAVFSLVRMFVRGA